MNHYQNYLETKQILGLGDDYFQGCRDELTPQHPEYKERLTALNKLIAGISRKQKPGRGVGSNVMEKIKL
jgi:hypothetical protein